VYSARERELDIFRSRSIRNATETAACLLTVIIGSAFCIIAPLVLVGAVLAFILNWISLRYRIL